MILAVTLAGALLATQSTTAPAATTSSNVVPPIVRTGSKSASLVAKQAVEMKKALRDDGRDDAQTASATKAAQSLFPAPGKVKVVGAECTKTLCQVRLTAGAGATTKLIAAIDDPQAMSKAATAGYRIVALASPATTDSRGPQQVTVWLGQPLQGNGLETQLQPA